MGGSIKFCLLKLTYFFSIIFIINMIYIIYRFLSLLTCLTLSAPTTKLMFYTKIVSTIVHSNRKKSNEIYIK